MASAAEITFINTMRAAEGVRQSAVQSAYATYLAAGLTPTAMATYAAALQTAQDAYTTSLNTALGTLGLIGKGSNIALGDIGITDLYGGIASTFEGLS